MNSVETRLDPAKFQSISEKILDLDPDIMAAYILRAPNGQVIAEAVRPEFKRTLGGLSQSANGMVSQWNIVAFNLMQRLDSVRSKARYLLIGRDELKGLIFPVPPSETHYVVLTLAKKANVEGLYENVLEHVKNLPS